MGASNISEEQFARRVASKAICSTIELTESGLVLGARTCLAHMARDRYGASSLAIESDRVLVLLKVAYGSAVSADVLRHIEAASGHWQNGDKVLANIRLVYAGLPRIDGNDAYRLFLAEALLDEGIAPRTLMKALGIDAPYEHEPRDSHGRWTSGPDSGTQVAVQEKKPDQGDFKDQSYEWRRRAGLTTPQEDVEHGHARPLPEPLISPGEVPKNVLLGLNGKPGNKGKFFSDLPGGKDEAQKLFDALTHGQQVTTTIIDTNSMRIRARDGTQLRIYDDGNARIDRPIAKEGRMWEVIHFGRKRR